MSIVTFYSVILNLRAFINLFFIFLWATNIGYTWTFAAQGIITCFFCVHALVAIHWFGSSVRAKCDLPIWVSPECDVSGTTIAGEEIQT